MVLAYVVVGLFPWQSEIHTIGQTRPYCSNKKHLMRYCLEYGNFFPKVCNLRETVIRRKQCSGDMELAKFRNCGYPIEEPNYSPQK